ncbi:MAG TPA: hypothetical protein VNX18_22050 [Bryobacteraceae bacterium]|nr:hypothetical protein [Bryobacteraceae bacterium]
MPWIWIAADEKWRGRALQLRLAGNFQSVLGSLPAVCDVGEALEQGFTGAARGPVAPFDLGAQDEEHIADFCLIAHRSLDEFENRLFRYHFLLGADWKLCSRRLGIDRGNFFHAVYRIEQKLGRVFRELEPYALFPVDEYFNGPPKIAPARALAIREFPHRPKHLEFPHPLGKTA